MKNPPKPEDISKTKEKYSVRYKTPAPPPVQAGDGELASAHNLIKALICLLDQINGIILCNTNNIFVMNL